ncbi:hypothetical protein GCM10009850_047750 [Nonomuraea monospora]|uniref:Uncharacterized protein n=1 Tax=Nonomuraea monospora TaxID=568818 RepID=A0ABN3CIS4_9ACTN
MIGYDVLLLMRSMVLSVAEPDAAGCVMEATIVRVIAVLVVVLGAVAVSLTGGAARQASRLVRVVEVLQDVHDR